MLRLDLLFNLARLPGPRGCARSLRRILAIAALGLLGAASPAAAKTFCVNSASCVQGGGSAEPSIAAAVADAKSAYQGGDPRSKIAIGPGAIQLGAHGEADDVAPNPIDFVGSGQGQTIIEDNSPGGARAFGITDPSSTISDLTIKEVSPPGNPTTFGLGALLLRDGATAQRVTIDGTQAGPSSVGLDIRGSARFLNGTIQMAAPSGAVGVGYEEGGGDIAARVSPSPVGDPAAAATISGSSLTGVSGLTVLFGGHASADHLHISAIGVGAVVSGGRLDLYDSLIQTRSVSNLSPRLPPSAPSVGLSAVTGGADATLHAESVTIVGDGTGYGIAAGGGVGAGPGTVLARDVVIANVATDIISDPQGGSANVDIDYSSFRWGSTQGSGGAIHRGPHTLNTGSPLFVNPGAGNYALRACSPLIDAGNPAGLGSGDPSTDLAGNPRVVSGAGFGQAIRDIGAYEYLPPRGTHASCGALSISGSTAHVFGRAVRIGVSCFSGRTGCKGKLSLSIQVRKRRGGRFITQTDTLGRASYNFRAGRSGTVRVSLSGDALGRIAGARRHRLTVNASAVAAGISDPTGVSSTTLVLAG